MLFQCVFFRAWHALVMTGFEVFRTPLEHLRKFGIPDGFEQKQWPEHQTMTRTSLRVCLEKYAIYIRNPPVQFSRKEWNGCSQMFDADSTPIACNHLCNVLKCHREDDSYGWCKHFHLLGARLALGKGCTGLKEQQASYWNSHSQLLLAQIWAIVFG